MQPEVLLIDMADHLAKAKAFSFSVDANYDVTQPSGQKIEFGETYHVLLSRPDALRIDFEDRDSSERRILFNGSTMTMFTPGQEFYGSLKKPGSVDQIINYIVKDLETPIPMSVLLVTSAPQELRNRVTEVTLVGDETLDGTPVYHLAARASDIDFQVWIAHGGAPVPRRVVITYKQAPGEPQFSAMLNDWNFNPDIKPSNFIFNAPPGAKPIGFIVPVNSATAASDEGDNK